MRHGGKVTLCSTEGCTNNAHNEGVCKRHGAKKYKYDCSADGCTNWIVNGGVCRRHGAKAKLCSSESTNHAKKGGVCVRHGAKLIRKIAAVKDAQTYDRKRK